MKKYLCICLAVLMLTTVLAGCNGLVGQLLSSEQFESLFDPLFDETTETETESFTEPQPMLPETSEPELLIDPAVSALNQIRVDWKGQEFVVLTRDDFMPEEWMSENRTGALDNAVYERNRVFEEFCNLDLNVVYASSAEIPSLTKQDIQGGLHEYDLLHTNVQSSFNMATYGYLHSFTDLNEVDLTAPWWDQGTANLVLADRIYFMNSDINYSDNSVTHAIFFNKALAAKENIDPYAIVHGNQWTVDQLRALIKDTNEDINGDAVMDENDYYGFISNYSTADSFFYGADLRYVVCDKGASPSLAMDETALNKASDLLDKMLYLYYGNNATFMSVPGHENNGLSIFKQGRGVFYEEVLSYAPQLRYELNTDLGILPVPKYDTEQESYVSYVHLMGATSSIPLSVENIERLGPTLEALAIISRQKVNPAYYDSLLSYGNACDEKSRAMLDIIFGSRTYDLGNIYVEMQLDSLFKTCVADNKSNFASSVAKNEKIALKRLEKLGSMLTALQ